MNIVSTGTSDVQLETAADSVGQIMHEIYNLKTPVTFHDFQRLVYSVVQSSLGSNQYVTANTYQCAMAERFRILKSTQSWYSHALYDP